MRELFQISWILMFEDVNIDIENGEVIIGKTKDEHSKESFDDLFNKRSFKIDAY